MGTRALIKINIKNGERVAPLVCIYKQHDGYLSGLGATLCEFLSRKKIINGISGNPDPINTSNGACDFAGQLVYELKERQPLAGVYLYPTDTGDVGQDFTYTVTFAKNTSFDNIDVLNSVSIDCHGDVVEFSGENLLSELRVHIEKEDEEE